MALQHQQAVQGIHDECANIRHALGALEARLVVLEGKHGPLADDVAKLGHLKSKIVGGLIVLGVVAATVAGMFWYFVGPTWATLSDMAEERKVHDADKKAAKDEADAKALAAKNVAGSNSATP